ncbi:endolytic transglycosylase MltG [Salipaludibacillus agaradhaerens]|uniref:Endolytic murein transglycosylase n=1 Tax=Salipaludibacillus agaradhaerens TaxID=76935 RepID=A0A9Q4FZB9_SALAG|nr:endolytic transglycosylase MltG [Salipaludibacillus agaradhaerens]MCR6113568.1 endolytic transglycosylase MltG [Salipaludibacillus agaradhaerens]
MFLNEFIEFCQIYSIIGEVKGVAHVSNKKKLKEKHKLKMEENKQEASLVRKIVLIFFMSIIVIGIIAVFVGYRYIIGSIGPVDENDENVIEVTIPIGSNTSTIADVLEEAGVINSATVFTYYVRFQNESGFQAGEYHLTRSMSMEEIIDQLKEGRVFEDYAISFTIPEGLWVEDVFERVASETDLEQDELLTLARDEDYLNELIENYDFLDESILDEAIREPLEGYLFPARYDFVNEELEPEEVIEAMLDRTSSVLASLPIENMDDTFHELMTKASIIEGEAITDEERTTISGVIENRLQAGMPLQMDPTIAYAHGEHLSRTLYEHLDIESPYNTYNVTGLMPGPINNPGEASISAALSPESHNYLYFYHSPEGDIYFNENLSEHEAIVSQYRD